MAIKVKLIAIVVQVKQHGLGEPSLSANEEENDIGLIFGF